MQRELQEDGEQDVEVEDVAEGPLARELFDGLRNCEPMFSDTI